MSDETKTTEPTEEKDDELELDDSDLDELDLGDEEEEPAEGDDDKDPADGDGDKEPSDEKDRTAALNIQRKKFRDRALKAEAELAELKKKQPKPTSKKPDVSADKADRMDFRFYHPELSSKEVDEIEAIARAKGVSLEQAMKSPVIQVFLKASARKREHAKASPETRHRAAPRPKGKDSMDMSPEEFESFKRQVKSGQFKQ